MALKRRKSPMTLKRLILGMLGSLPEGQISGKKRLQKLAKLLELSGLNIEAEFEILHYGPYSRELAQAAEFLVLTGQIEESSEPVGVYRTYQSVYSLPDAGNSVFRLSKKYRDILRKLNEYSTVELEVAATIGHFQTNEGLSYKTAVEETKFMKPTKAIRPVLDKAKNILAICHN